MKAAMRDVLQEARLYMVYWVEKKGGVSAMDLPTIHLDYARDVSMYNYAHKDDKKRIRVVPKVLLDYAFEELLRDIPIKLRKAVAETIKCDKENLEPLKAWVMAVTGAIRDDDLYVMAHWLWLVKRNSQELPVVHHIMPIVTSSKQGGGKSTALTRLIEPLESLCLELKVPQVVDERSFTMFTNYLIGFLDELAGADKVDISDFKRNVTSSTLTYRPMRTNSQVKITNLCTFIGASNLALYENVKDTTGLRRFFPINAMDLLDHKSINEINYNELWKGIDDRLSRGYYERVKAQVAEKQEELSMKDEVHIFLEEHSIIPASNGDVKVVNGKLLYQDYLFSTKNAGIRYPVAAQTFYKKIRDLGVPGVKRRDERNVLTWFFQVDSNAVCGNITLLKESRV